MEKHVAKFTYIKIMQHLSVPENKGRLNSNSKENIKLCSLTAKH